MSGFLLKNFSQEILRGLSVRAPDFCIHSYLLFDFIPVVCVPSVVLASESLDVKPFLKWAGNKYPIIDRIRQLLPEGSQEQANQRLIEPFVGSAALFLNTNYTQNILSDVNEDLINVYRYVQQDGERFIRFAKQFFSADNNHPTIFYHWRETFNHTSDERLKAALFLYLNRHGYNGLCRYNSRGQFNVPFGRYQQPYFPEAELRAFHQKANDTYVTFEAQDFRLTMEQARAGDIVYCDPPYVPLTQTSNFTGYSQQTFGQAEQEALADMAKSLSENGVIVIISNHDTPFTQAAYESAKIYPFQVQRYISCQGAKRQKANEMLAVFTAS